MAILEYNEILTRKFIVIDGEPYEVIDAHIFRMQQRKPQNKTKLKNLISGSVKEMTFHASDKAEEADLEKKEVKFLFSNKGEWWFCEINDPSKRFKLEENLIGESRIFMKPNTLISVLTFDEGDDEPRIIGVKLPIKVDLKVTEAHPAVRGDTAKGGNKQVVLETGATINVPMFVNEGDVIRINTDTREYVERV
jgi:elongation factor P